jgi:hypothetical protein
LFLRSGGVSQHDCNRNARSAAAHLANAFSIILRARFAFILCCGEVFCLACGSRKQTLCVKSGAVNFVNVKLLHCLVCNLHAHANPVFHPMNFKTAKII